MKKLITMGAMLICAMALTSCGGAKDAAVSGADPAQIAGVLNESVNFSEELSEVSEDVILRRYGLDSNLVEAAAGYTGTPAVVDEIAVFKTTDVAAVEDAADARIESQKTTYSSYAPGEMPKLDDAVVTTIGDCVVVCVSDDASAAVSDILSAVAQN